MSGTLEWFENVCELLSSKPAEATKLILQFRSSPEAFNARDFLIMSTKPLVKFQAALVLQYACISRWECMNLNDKMTLGDILWGLIEPGNLPSYATNKLMQVFALFWKRGWTDDGSRDKNILFQQLVLKLQSLDSVSFAMRLTRCLVEEFNSLNSAEKCVTIDFHCKSHISFQKDSIINSIGLLSRSPAQISGLEMCYSIILCGYQISFIAMTRSLRSVTDAMLAVNGDLQHPNAETVLQSFDQLTTCLRSLCESLKAYNELFNWNFDFSVETVKKPGNSERKAIFFPFSLHISREIISTIFIGYELLRVLTHFIRSLTKKCNDIKKLNSSFPLQAWLSKFQSVSAELRCNLIEYRSLIVVYFAFDGNSCGQLSKLEYLDVLLTGLSPFIIRFSENKFDYGIGAHYFQSIFEVSLRSLFGSASSVIVFEHFLSGGVNLWECATCVSLMETVIQASLCTVQTSGTLNPFANGLFLHDSINCDLRAEEFEWIGLIWNRILFNYSLLECSQIALFLQLLINFGKSTYLLSFELLELSYRRIYLASKDGKHSNLLERVFTAKKGTSVELWQRVSTRYHCFDEELSVTSGNILENWRGTCLNAYLELWNALLDNESMLVFGNYLNPSIHTTVTLPMEMKYTVKSMAFSIFSDIFEFVSVSCISDLVQVDDAADEFDEELNEVNDILDSALNDFIGYACVLGRCKYGEALQLLGGKLSDVFNLYLHPMISQGNPKDFGVSQSKNLEILEICRIIILFISKLTSGSVVGKKITDDKDEDENSVSPSAGHSDLVIGDLSNTSLVFGEIPSISFWILDSCIAFKTNPTVDCNVVEVQRQLIVKLLPFVLQFENTLLMQGSELSDSMSVLLSPLLLQQIIELYTQYILLFVSNGVHYSGLPYAEYCKEILSIHLSVEQRFDPELSVIIELLLHTILNSLFVFRHETSLLQSSMECLLVLSKESVTRQSILSSKSFQNLVNLLLSAAMPDHSFQLGSQVVNSKEFLFKLPLNSLKSLVSTVVSVAIACESKAYLQQLCNQWLCCLQQFVVECNSKRNASEVKISLLKEFEGFLGVLLGLARCKSKEFNIAGGGNALHNVFQFAAIHLLGLINTYYKYGCEIDEIVLLYTLLLRDVGDHQLNFMSSSVSISIYQAADMLLPILTMRLPTESLKCDSIDSNCSNGASSLNFVESNFESDLLVITLQLLNFLSTRDFVLDDIDSVKSTDEIRNFEVTMTNTLVGYFLMLFKHMTVNLLQNYPLIAREYFGFCLYLMNSYSKQMDVLFGIQFENSNNADFNGVWSDSAVSCAFARLNWFISQVLWASFNSVDDTVIASCLSIIQSIANNINNFYSQITAKFIRLCSSCASIQTVIGVMTDWLMKPAGSSIPISGLQGLGLSVPQISTVSSMLYLHKYFELMIGSALMLSNSIVCNLMVQSESTESNKRMLKSLIAVDKSAPFGSALYSLLFVLYNSVPIGTILQNPTIPSVFFVEFQNATLATLTPGGRGATGDSVRDRCYHQLVELCTSGAVFSKNTKPNKTAFIESLKKFISVMRPLLTYV